MTNVHFFLFHFFNYYWLICVLDIHLFKFCKCVLINFGFVCTIFLEISSLLMKKRKRKTNPKKYTQRVETRLIIIGCFWRIELYYVYNMCVFRTTLHCRDYIKIGRKKDSCIYVKERRKLWRTLKLVGLKSTNITWKETNNKTILHYQHKETNKIVYKIRNSLSYSCFDYFLHLIFLFSVCTIFDCVTKFWYFNLKKREKLK